MKLKAGKFGWDYVLIHDDGTEQYIQSDWDYPGVASLFGWVACECGCTDGTIDCKHKTASDMMQSAQNYLDEIAE